MDAILKSISGHFDRSTNTLWFSGELVSGAHFDVGFPIAHVAVTFDSKMAALNFVADPVCGGLISVDGFLGNYEAVCNCDNKNAQNAAVNAYAATMDELSNQALHYAANGHDAVLGSIFTKIGKAVGSVAKTAVHIATAPARAVVNVTKAAVTGQNVAKAAYGELKSHVADIKAVAPIAQTVFSVVPGVGTIASVAIGATMAGLEGKSLTEIVKAAGVSAIPGGPLAQQIAKAGINTIQAGVEGKNMLKAAATQAISSVASVIPDATARQFVERVALDAAAGRTSCRPSSAPVSKRQST